MRSRPAFRRGYVQFISVVLAGAVLGFSMGSTTAGPTSGSGLKPISQAALQGLIDATARELLVPGAVVLLCTPQGDFTAATGTTQLNTKNPPRADTHFRIASNTKTITAAVIMQLAQESKLGLNDPVSKYVSGVPNGDNITIGQLLEMRSGLYNYTNDPIISATIDTDPAKVWTPPSYWQLHLHTHPISRRVQSTNTTTPTMRFSVSSLKRSTASR
jgi:D-alanyl-D-alanine carboxypeptidase